MGEISWIEYELQHETTQALLVRVMMQTGHAANVWLPKKLVEAWDGKLIGLPAWLARAKGIRAGRFDHV